MMLTSSVGRWSRTICSQKTVNVPGLLQRIVGARKDRRLVAVCESRDHYAVAKHAANELAAAKAKGRSLISYAATLSPKRGARVLNSHIEYLERSESDSENRNSASSETSVEVNVADVSENNYTKTETNFEIDAYQFNRSIANSSANSALVFSLASSWENDMTKEIANMTRSLAGDDHDFGGIVIDTDCAGASVVSSD
jgi:hypothetical protein